MRKKSELYPEEQKKICDKIIEILALDDENSVYLYDLDNDDTKSKQIMDLLPEIRTFFSFSYIMGAKEPEKLKRPWLSIIKYSTKKYYKMYKNVINITRNDKVVRTTQYLLIKIE